MIIPLLLIFTAFPLLIAAIGFFLKISKAIETETVFYYLSGVMLSIIAITSFASGIQYETGANSTVIGNNTIYTYSYTNADLQSTTLVSLSLLACGLFLIITGYTENKNRKKAKIEDEGDSSW